MIFLLNDVTRIILSIVIVIVCVFLFIGTYLLNKRTKAPEGCKNSSSECEGCAMIGCSKHPQQNKEKEINKNND